MSGNLYTFINDPTIQDHSTIIELSEKPTKSRIFTHNLNMAVLSLYIHSGQEKRIFFLGAKPGDKNSIFVLNLHVHKHIVF